jgi:hypothetical protein
MSSRFKTTLKPNTRRPCSAEDGSTISVGRHAADLDTFTEIRERLIAAGASDRIVTEFGRKLSIFFRDPDQMESAVLVANPDADLNDLGFGTPSPRFT